MSESSLELGLGLILLVSSLLLAVKTARKQGPQSPFGLWYKAYGFLIIASLFMSASMFAVAPLQGFLPVDTYMNLNEALILVLLIAVICGIVLVVRTRLFFLSFGALILGAFIVSQSFVIID